MKLIVRVTMDVEGDEHELDAVEKARETLRAQCAEDQEAAAEIDLSLFNDVVECLRDMNSILRRARARTAKRGGS